jgi:limonene-1,2-epoxide hydrolase
MGAQQEAVVREMLTAWGDGDRSPDIQRIVSCFAEHARWTLYMPDGPTIVGRAAIRAELVRQATYVERVKSQIGLVASSDDMVIVERRDHFVRNGRPIDRSVAGAFGINAEGLITAWRDYFDGLDFARQAAVSPDLISGLEGATATPGLDPRPPIPEAADGSGLPVALHPPQGPQQTFIEAFCDAWGDGTATSRPDVDRIVAMMAPDAQWRLWVPGGPLVQGRDALRAEINRQIAYSGHNKCNTVHAVSNDHVVIQERSDWAVLLGRPCPHQMIAIYELGDDGLIVRWREYINMADLDRKRGVKAEVAHAQITPLSHLT